MADIENLRVRLIKDVISFFGSESIIEQLSDFDLKSIDDDRLLELIDNPSSLLEMIEDWEIIDYLEMHNYKVIDTLAEEKKSVLDMIGEVCREIQPNGIIDKEDAKRMICDYIDTWMTNGF